MPKAPGPRPLRRSLFSKIGFDSESSDREILGRPVARHSATPSKPPGFDGVEPASDRILSPQIRVAMRCVALHICFILQWFALHGLALLCIALHCFASHCFALLCIALLCIPLLCLTLPCIALLCFALLCLCLLCLSSSWHLRIPNDFCDN